MNILVHEYGQWRLRQEGRCGPQLRREYQDEAGVHEKPAEAAHSKQDHLGSCFCHNGALIAIPKDDTASGALWRSRVDNVTALGVYGSTVCPERPQLREGEDQYVYTKQSLNDLDC